MLVSESVRGALAAQREAFQQAAARASLARDSYLSAWDDLCLLSPSSVEAELGGIPWPGARPTGEWVRGGVIPFEQTWETAQDARAWALDILSGVPTVAVDGSQIAASKEFGVPVSLVQVAWFENPHLPAGRYVKDLRNEVLAPDDPPEEIGEYVFAESRLNRRRFVLEMETLADRARRLPAEKVPVLFHDGSFALSFAGRMPPATRDAYLGALFDLLDASRECAIPVAGYVDLSFASDLVTMLRHACDLPRANLFDAFLLAPRMDMFDRTNAFRCAREDIIPQYCRGERDYTADICFVYLKTGVDRIPSRIDFPAWVLDHGLLDHVMNVIRAEIVVGGGYPYALETADAAAVLTTEDRRAFYRLWHDFAEEAGLAASLPGKSVSKQLRR